MLLELVLTPLSKHMRSFSFIRLFFYYHALSVSLFPHRHDCISVRARRLNRVWSVCHLIPQLPMITRLPQWEARPVARLMEAVWKRWTMWCPCASRTHSYRPLLCNRLLYCRAASCMKCRLGLSLSLSISSPSSSSQSHPACLAVLIPLLFSESMFLLFSSIVLFPIEHDHRKCPHPASKLCLTVRRSSPL